MLLHHEHAIATGAAQYGAIVFALGLPIVAGIVAKLRKLFRRTRLPLVGLPPAHGLPGNLPVELRVSEKLTAWFVENAPDPVVVIRAKDTDSLFVEDDLSCFDYPTEAEMDRAYYQWQEDQLRGGDWLANAYDDLDRKLES